MRRFSRSAKTYGFELLPPPRIAPADAGQGELFGDEFSQPDLFACSAQANAADGEPLFWPDAADRRSPKPPPGHPQQDPVSYRLSVIRRHLGFDITSVKSLVVSSCPNPPLRAATRKRPAAAA